MINALCGLLLNTETELAPDFTPVTISSAVQTVQSIFRLQDEEHLFKALHLVFGTELKQYLPEKLRQISINLTSGSYFTKSTYPIVQIRDQLRQTNLQPFFTLCSRKLEASTLSNLRYIYTTHSNSVYAAAAILVMLLLYLNTLLPTDA